MYRDALENTLADITWEAVISTTKSSIEWCDRTWNPVRGCSRISKGCERCYAEKVAARFSDPGQPFHLYADRHKSGSKWTGKVELIEKALAEPLRWRKPARIFVNSMSDLFHENLPDEAIDRIFAVMVLCPQHTFQVLTKRAHRMREYCVSRQERMRSERSTECPSLHTAWPDFLSNVWMGVSVEDQKTADERIPELLRTPATVRFVSYEPALGPVDLDSERVDGLHALGCGDPDCCGRDQLPECAGCHGVDWVIVGGESGANARPMNPEWAQSLRDQCIEAGVPFHFKQWGEYCDWDQLPEDTYQRMDAAGCDASDSPIRVGKKAAGCLLDGREWKQFPVVPNGK